MQDMAEDLAALPWGQPGGSRGLSAGELYIEHPILANRHGAHERDARFEGKVPVEVAVESE